MKTLLTIAALVATGHAFSVVNKAVHPSTKLSSTAGESVDRRAFLWTGVATSLTVVIPAVAEDIDPSKEEPKETVVLDYKDVAKDILKAVQDNPDWGPTLVRLAWHSSGTYDKMSKTGGSGGGTIRFKEELAHGGNAGLSDTAVKWLDPIHAKYAESGLSYADLYTLAGGEFISECRSHCSPRFH